jgi:hypothetical protein
MDSLTPLFPLQAAPAPGEDAWRCWRHAVVRDLAWVLASPPLLQPPQTEARWLDTAWSARAWEASRDWLAELDRDPQELQAALARRPGRLGSYFESLLAAWLGWPGNPLYRLVRHGLPVRSGLRTVGELDFLVEERGSGELQHWEVAVKFYLGVAPGGAHADWVGPGLKDRLDLKVDRLLGHQLGLGRTPVAARLLEELGLPCPSPVCLLRGRLFYPPQAGTGGWAPLHAAPGHLGGWWMPQADFLRYGSDLGLGWMRLPREHWLAPVDTRQPDSTVRIGDAQAAVPFIEALRASPDNRAAAVVGLQDGREVTRGFITPADWPQLRDSA